MSDGNIQEGEEVQVVNQSFVEHLEGATGLNIRMCSKEEKQAQRDVVAEGNIEGTIMKYYYLVDRDHNNGPDIPRVANALKAATALEGMFLHPFHLCLTKYYSIEMQNPEKRLTANSLLYYCGPDITENPNFSNVFFDIIN